MREKTFYEENIQIPIPKDEVVSAIEEKNQIWYRKMYTIKSGIICEHKNNPVRQDAFMVYYHSEPVTIGPGLSSVIETYPIMVHLTERDNHTEVNITIIRKNSVLAAFVIALVMASGFVIVPLFIPSEDLGGHLVRGFLLLAGLFGVFMLLKYFWIDKPEDVMPGVTLLKEMLQELGQK